MDQLKTNLFNFVKPFAAKPHNPLSWNLDTLFGNVNATNWLDFENAYFKIGQMGQNFKI